MAARAAAAAATRAVLDSRARVFAAAAAEFAARGYAGANVDRIARAARVNKAMIYYHYKSKAALYRAILRDMFDAVSTRVRSVAAGPLTPEEKIRGFIEAIAAAGEARPHFPPIWLRELAEGGAHVDEATLAYVRDVLQALGGILQEGRRAGRFQPVNPLLIHIGIVAPLMLFLATAPLREKLGRVGPRGAMLTNRTEVVTHIERITLAVLEGRIA
jgi:TetR/AcrR family transcriptional regulator